MSQPQILAMLKKSRPTHFTLSRCGEIIFLLHSPEHRNLTPVVCRNTIGENQRGIAKFATVDEGLYERDRGAYKARRGP